MGNQAWTSDANEIFAIQFLDWVGSYEGSGSLPHALSFYGDGDGVSPEQKEALVAVVQDLHSRDLIGGHRSMGGWATFSAMLTASGRQLVRDRQASRSAKRERSVAARDSLLDWMFENTDDRFGECPEISEFIGTTHSHIYGDPFTQDEVAAATRYLHKEGYVGGISSGGGELSRPSVKEKGQQAVERGTYTAMEASAVSNTNNILTIHGDNAGQAAAGHTVHQEQTVGTDLSRLPDLIEHVRSALSGLPENDVSGAEAYLTVIEAVAAQEEPNRGVLDVAGRGLLSLGDKATNALTGASIRTLWMYLADKFEFPAA